MTSIPGLLDLFAKVAAALSLSVGIVLVASVSPAPTNAGAAEPVIANGN